MLLEFPSVVDAVECAVAVQAAMHQRNEGVPIDRRMLFRIGINLGDILIEGEDILGDGVNIAARIEGVAEPGGICISSSGYEQVRGKVAVEFIDLGELRLKNINRPVRVYAAKQEGRATDVPSGVSSRPETQKALPLPDNPSIAVLTFQNMSGDAEQEYFSDGMAEDIITALSRFKSLFVIARNSTFTYKGKAVDITQIGRELGVRYALEGSVRKAGSKVRITCQLIEATNGTHLWADQFDGTLDDIFEFQDKVTSSVVGAIEPSVTRAEIERARRKPPGNLNAYDCFQRGQWAHWQFTKDGTNEAISFYEQAIALDTQFAAAYAALASAFYQRRGMQWSASPASDTSRSMECARHALRLNPEDPATLVRIALVFSAVGGEVERADSLFSKAIRHNPNGMDAWTWGGWAKVFLGDHQSAVEYFRRAIRLSPADPRNFHAQSGVAIALFFTGDFEEGRKHALEGLRDHPADLTALRAAVACSASMGDMGAARDFYRQLVALSPSERVADLRKRAPYRREEDYAKLEQIYRAVGMPE